MTMLRKIITALQDCPYLPLYLIFGLFSNSRSLTLAQVDDTSLAEILNYYHSDKATLHSYDLAYTRIFSGLRYDTLNILEVGIGSNNSSIPFNMGVSASVGGCIFLA